MSEVQGDEGLVGVRGKSFKAWGNQLVIHPAAPLEDAQEAREAANDVDEIVILDPELRKEIQE